MVYIAKYNLQTSIYYKFYDNAPSTKDDTTKINIYFNHGPMCGGMT